jgi:predicted amidohydrolase
MHKVALIQFGINDAHTKKERIAHAAELIDQAADADLIIFPEVWNIGWWNWDLYKTEAETLQGETVSMCADKARQVNAYIHCGTIIEKRGDDLYNTAVLLDPKGNVIGQYSKIHTVAWESLGALEGKICKKGEELVYLKTELGILGLTICYDMRFPEIYRKLVCNHGCDVLICTAAWNIVRVDDWRNMIHARATENEAYVLACGCAGVNQGKTYAGFSRIVDPHGTIVASGNIYEAIVEGKIDKEQVAKVRKQIPGLEDRHFDV